MYSEKVELNYSHVNLGALDEYGLLLLFASMHSKALVSGLALTVEEICDVNGHYLYPAYYYTHFTVPPHRPLRLFRAWNTYTVNTDLKRFGRNYIESRYSFTDTDTDTETEDPMMAKPVWSSAQWPTMAGNNLFIIADTEDAAVSRQLAVPKKGHLADIPKVKKPPAAIQGAKKAQEQHAIYADFKGQVADSPFQYSLVNCRDTVPGHALIFAKYTSFFDMAESDFWKQKGHDLSDIYLDILDREIYYYGNALANESIDIRVCSQKISAETGDNTQGIVGRLISQCAAYRSSTLDLLALSYSIKAIRNKN